jgi:hypothetical protein
VVHWRLVATAGLAADAAAIGQDFDAVRTEVLWRRLIGIVDEASARLVRSAFSTVPREADDCAVVITDARAGPLAQGTKSLPSFIGAQPRIVAHVLAGFATKGIAPGDLFGQMVALHLTRRRQEALLQDWEPPDLEGFAAANDRAEAALRRALRRGARRLRRP